MLVENIAIRLVKVDTDWQVALGDGYTTFEDDIRDYAYWDNLQIRVKPLSNEKAQEQAALY